MNLKSESSITATRRLMRHAKITARILESSLFRSYQEIFQASAGLPLALNPLGREQEPSVKNCPNQNRFCQLLNQGGGCSKCLEVHQSLAESEGYRVRSVTCFAGLQETAIPIMVGKEMIAQLRTGQVLHEVPTQSAASELCGHLAGSNAAAAELEDAYMVTPVMDRQKYLAAVTLLSAFSLQLTRLANQINAQLESEEDEFIGRVNDYIDEHIMGHICLEDAAKTVGVSPCHFCRKFKRFTGKTFMECVTARKVEMVKDLLLATGDSITRIAFDAGFRSLSQFNRCFRRIEGVNPTQFREAMAA